MKLTLCRAFEPYALSEIFLLAKDQTSEIKDIQLPNYKGLMIFYKFSRISLLFYQKSENRITIKRKNKIKLRRIKAESYGVRFSWVQ